MIKRETAIIQGTDNKTLNVTRAFDAPLAQVWKAWTDSEILDQWWAPKPYHTETKTMDFREGGLWLYEMVGPQGDRSWCKEAFKTIEEQKLITNAVCFCDADGNDNPDFPVMKWKKEFNSNGSETTVNIEITFAKEEDLETIVKMGFKEGFAMGLSNLDDYLSQQAK